MKTSTAMTRAVVVVSPTVGLPAARRLMERMNIRHLPVVIDGRLVGIVSDRDLLGRPEGVDPGTCGEVMTPSPLTCSPDSSVGTVAAMMIEHKIDSLPVVLGERLIGLVTSTDLLELLVERDQAQVLPFDFHLHHSPSDENLDALLKGRARARLVA
jgi:acetoin utilization protein AcuB